MGPKDSEQDHTTVETMEVVRTPSPSHVLPHGSSSHRTQMKWSTSSPSDSSQPRSVARAININNHGSSSASSSTSTPPPRISSPSKSSSSASASASASLSRIPRRPPIMTPSTPADSFSSSTSSSALLASAPTPNNTFTPIEDEEDGGGGVFGTRTWASTSGSGDPDMRIMDNYQGDISIDQSLTPTSSRYHHRQSMASSHAESRLLPSVTTSINTTNSEIIPFSSRPIPIPPTRLLSSESRNKTNPFGDGDGDTPSGGIVKFDENSIQPQHPGVDLEASTSSGASAGESITREKRQADIDAQRLQQLGYDAVLGRDYTFWSSLSISWLNIGCIQGTIYAVSGAYSYGGPKMILVMWPISAVFSICLVLTLSELASAYPVAGAMASWAWKCARGGVGRERGWAWLMGGAVMGGHIANALLVNIELCNITAGTIALSLNYQTQTWHLVLFYLAVLLVCGTLGSQRWGRSHMFWLISGGFGVGVWLTMCISLLATGASHHGSNFIEDSRFFNDTNFTSKPYVYILGWVYCTIASGADASAHMAEETQNPSRNVPNAMTASMVLAYTMGYISIVLLLLSISPDDAAVIAKHDFPVGYILAHAINRPGAIGICCLLIIVLILQISAQLQASSRFVFALARDNAMPFSEQIKRTNKSKLPIVAHWLVIALCTPFALLPFGSNTVLYSVLATTASTLSYFGYVVPAFLYLVSKLDLQREGRTSWSLRRFSRPSAALGVLFGVAVIVVAMFPGDTPVNVLNISWSPVVLVGTGLICFITWKSYGNKHYSGPIRALTKWETGVEIDLQTTLNSRSKATNDNDLSLQQMDSQIKATEPFETNNMVHTVTVESANSLDMTGSEWTDATASSVDSSSDATISRPERGRAGESFTSSLGGVVEVDERNSDEGQRPR